MYEFERTLKATLAANSLSRRHPPDCVALRCAPRIVPADDGNDPEARDEPHQTDHDQGTLLCALPQVAQRRCNRPVAVHAQGEQAVLAV
jgi:hypothetical protein